MLDLAGGTMVYLSCGVTDLRRSYNGLAAIIKLKFHLDLYSRCMFAFCNRRSTSIKILQWDGSGFWILMKRLDRNAFHWPDTPDELRQVTLKETVAYQAVSRIGILYKIEEMIHDKTPEEKYEERQKQSLPVMDALFEWLHTMEDSVDRSSLIGDAILYTLNQEVYLRRYLEDGHLSIDNNSAERALKNFAVGRRNWLFAKSVRGADASALVYSITETALLNNLKPYAYLTYILDELRKMGAFPKEEELKKLLPWSEDLPEYCRTKLKK